MISRKRKIEQIKRIIKGDVSEIASFNHTVIESGNSKFSITYTNGKTVEVSNEEFHKIFLSLPEAEKSIIITIGDID